MWRDEKWRALDETRSMSVFVARLKRRIFNERLSGAFQTNHFPREGLWHFSASHWKNPPFPRACSRFEMQLEGDEDVPLVSLHQILTKKTGNHKFWVCLLLCQGGNVTYDTLYFMTPCLFSTTSLYNTYL